jgi:hypothetical protein
MENKWEDIRLGNKRNSWSGFPYGYVVSENLFLPKKFGNSDFKSYLTDKKTYFIEVDDRLHVQRKDLSKLHNDTACKLNKVQRTSFQILNTKL